MLKKVLIVLGIIITIIAILVGYGIYAFSPNQDHILNYLEENPETTSIRLIRNGEVIAEQNSNQMMPLASTVKIIIAVEYAEQASKGFFSPDSMIALTELDRYYIQGTDGGAHPGWLQEIDTDSSSIREIAQGMIKYSSNANTEWLTAFLGPDRVNNRIDSLGIKDHSEIYYIVSSLLVGPERFPGLTGEVLVDSLRALSDDEYIDTISEIHHHLAADTTYKNQIALPDLASQRVWSDRLPASTTMEYTELMKKFNSKSYFDPQTQIYLDEVMEWIMENPANQDWLEYSGMKGGSTAFVLTKSLYATDAEGNTTEMAYFINDLGLLESLRLQGSMNAFELAILTDDEFTEEVRSAFN